MKFLVGVFVVILGVSFIGKLEAWYSSSSSSWGSSWGSSSSWSYNKKDTAEIKEVSQITECTYTTKSSTLHCTSPSGPTKCKAVIIEDMSPLRYIQFGLGELNSSLAFSEDVKFRMFPRKLDQSAWLTNSFFTNNKEFQFSIYYADHNMDQGIRVTDKACYEKLFDLLKSSVRSETVFLQSDLPVKPTVTLIGDIFIHESL